MDRIRRLGQRRARAQADADAALEEAFDLIAAAYEAGDRVNIKQASELLGLTRKPVYAELQRRGLRAA